MDEWARIMATKTNMRISVDLLTASFHHPGVDISMLDRDGNPSMTSLLFLTYTARSIAIRGRNEKGQCLLGWEWTRDNCFNFVVSLEMSVSKVIYSTNFIDDSSQRSLYCTFSVVHVGSTSMVTLIRFWKNGLVVISVVLRTVSVESTTRKPKAYPVRVQQMTRGNGIMNWTKDRPRLTPLVRPVNTFVHHLTVTWYDTDNYNHCNFTSYARFVVDAIHSGLKANRNSKSKNKKGKSTKEITSAIQTKRNSIATDLNFNTATNYTDNFSTVATNHFASRRRANKANIIAPHSNELESQGETERLKTLKKSDTNARGHELTKGDNRNKSRSALENTRLSPSTTSGVDSHSFNLLATRQVTICADESNVDNDSFVLKNCIIKNGIKEFKILYFKECVEGQLLDVHVWQVGLKETSVFSSVESEGDIICQVVLEYFKPESKL